MLVLLLLDISCVHICLTRAGRIFDGSFFSQKNIFRRKSPKRTKCWTWNVIFLLVLLLSLSFVAVRQQHTSPRLSLVVYPYSGSRKQDDFDDGRSERKTTTIFFILYVFFDIALNVIKIISPDDDDDEFPTKTRCARLSPCVSFEWCSILSMWSELDGFKQGRRRAVSMWRPSKFPDNDNAELCKKFLNSLKKKKALQSLNFTASHCYEIVKSIKQQHNRMQPSWMEQ